MATRVAGTVSVPAGTGSGLLWDAKGHIVTNYHVIQRASGAQIRLTDALPIINDTN